MEKLKASLQKFKEAFERSTQGEWKVILGRPPVSETVYKLKDEKDPKSEIVSFTKNGLDPRWDVFVGEDLSLEEINKTPKHLLGTLLKDRGRRQIAHLHPESPMIYERAWNYEGDSNFIVTAHNE